MSGITSYETGWSLYVEPPKDITLKAGSKEHEEYQAWLTQKERK